MLKTYALVISLLVTPAAADALDDAYVAAAGDCITTGGALAFGLTELNPLGPIAACALKPALIRAADAQPEPQRTESLHAINAIWSGAVANNLFAIAGTGAAAPVFGILAALVLWNEGEREREFARLCAVHRHLAGQKLACKYA